MVRELTPENKGEGRKGRGVSEGQDHMAKAQDLQKWDSERQTTHSHGRSDSRQGGDLAGAFR